MLPMTPCNVGFVLSSLTSCDVLFRIIPRVDAAFSLVILILLLIGHAFIIPPSWHRRRKKSCKFLEHDFLYCGTESAYVINNCLHFFVTA